MRHRDHVDPDSALLCETGCKGSLHGITTNCFLQVEDKTRFPSNLTTSTMQLLENQHSKPRDPTLSISKQVIDTRRPSKRLEGSICPFLQLCSEQKYAVHPMDLSRSQRTLASLDTNAGT